MQKIKDSNKDNNDDINDDFRFQYQNAKTLSMKYKVIYDYFQFNYIIHCVDDDGYRYLFVEIPNYKLSKVELTLLNAIRLVRNNITHNNGKYEYYIRYDIIDLTKLEKLFKFVKLI